MKTYLASQQVRVTMPLVDNDAAVFTASAASYRVLDELGSVVVGPTAITPWVGNETQAVVTVPGASNQLAGAATRGLRQVEITFTTPAGSVVLVDGYVIEALEPLLVPTNSFQLYGAAQLKAASMPALDAWKTASRADHIPALMAARDALCALTYRWQELQDPFRYVEPVFVVQRLDLLDHNDYIALTWEFRDALERAQVIQANHLLGGDGVGKWREAGLLSMTTGESSQMFRPGAPLRMPVCVEALHIVGRYVDYSKRIGRR